MIRKLHRGCAIILGSYIMMHLTNHIVALGGAEQHIALMQTLRKLYRWPPIEILLLTAALVQISTGTSLAWRGRGLRQDWKAKLQLYSGLYLAFFLLVHTSAVLVGRHVLQVDTNFYFAASVVVSYPYKLFYMPYYFLGVASFFTHVGLALYYNLNETWRGRGVLFAMIALGCLIGVGLVATFSGALYTIELPNEYKLP